MRLHSFRLRDMGPFADASLDLDAIDGAIVAVCGVNMAGKTTALETAFAGALYRKTPTRGTLAEVSTSRMSEVESRIGDYVITHYPGTGKALVEHCDGRVLNPSGMVTGFDAWAKGALPPADLFYASVFGAQGAKGFIGMKEPADRKGVLLRALGIERYEVLAKRAGARRDAASGEVDKLVARLADERKRATSLDVAQGAFDTAAAALSKANDVLALERAALATAREQNATRGAAVERAQAHAGRLSELQRERAELVTASISAERRRDAERAKLGDATQVREEAAQADAQRAVCAALTAAIDAADEHDERLLELAGNVATTDERVCTLEAKRAGLVAAVADAGTIRATAAEVETLRAQLAAAETAAREATARASEGLRVAYEADGASIAEADKARAARLRAADAVDRIAALAGAEEAAARLPALRAELAAAEEAERAAQAAGDAEIARVREAESAAGAARLRASDARKRALAAAVRTDAAKGAEEAAAWLPGLRANEKTAAAAVATADAEVKRLHTLMFEGKDMRIEGLRAGLREASTEGFEGDAAAVVVVADRAIAADNRLEAEHAEAPDALDGAKGIADAASAAWVAAERALRDAETLAARVPDLEAAREEEREASAAAAQAEVDNGTHAAAAALAAVRSSGHYGRAVECRAEVRRLRPLVADTEKLVAGLAERAAAEVERRTAIETAELAEAEAHRQSERGRVARAESNTHSTVAAARSLQADRLRPLFEAAERASRRITELVLAETALRDVDEQLVVARAAAETAATAYEALGPEPTRPTAAAVAGADAALRASEAAVARLPALASAEATIAGLDEAIAAAGAGIARVDGMLAALGPAPSVPLVADLVAAEAAVGSAEWVQKSMTTAHVRAEAALEAARASAARVADLETQLRAAEDLVADWALVATGLGKNGIQALEIDAAGPELTGLVNDLLRACMGTTWTVTIATTRAKKNGDGDREVCDVLVVENGQEKEARFLSGGAASIVGEAVALALSALACRRAGLQGMTLVRDETAGLDEEHARSYVAMLRRAAVMVGASKVLFISHNRATWALADARVFVREGRIDVEGEAAPVSVELETREAA